MDDWRGCGFVLMNFMYLNICLMFVICDTRSCRSSHSINTFLFIQVYRLSRKYFTHIVTSLLPNLLRNGASLSAVSFEEPSQLLRLYDKQGGLRTYITRVSNGPINSYAVWRLTLIMYFPNETLSLKLFFPSVNVSVKLRDCLKELYLLYTRTFSDKPLRCLDSLDSFTNKL